MEDRRLRINERPNRAIFLSWLALCGLLLLIAWKKVAANSFPGPDDALRLVQLRDLLNGQGWYDLHQYRIDPPDGVLMHWSRIVDVPLWVCLKVLTPLLGQPLAEHVTMVVIPLLLLGLIMLAVGRLAWRLFDVQTAIFASLAVALWPYVVMQIQPMRIDHHAYQIMCVAMAAWALSWRSPLRGGAFAGVMMALGTMISLETLPMAAAFGGILALRWLGDYRARWWLVSYMQALALGMAVLFALTRATDLAPHCDVIAPAHLGFFLITALGTGVIGALPKMPRAALIVMFGVAGAAGLGFVALVSRQCFTPPFAGLDPTLYKYWYRAVKEGLPLWDQDASRAIPAVLQMLVALCASIALWARSDDWHRRWWAEYTLLLLAAITAGCLTFRSLSFPGVLGAVPMGWLACRLLRYFRATDRISAKLLAAAAMYLVLLPSTPFVLYEKLAAIVAPSEKRPEKGNVTLRNSTCLQSGDLALLNKLPPAKLFATMDIGPSVLLHTHHSVVGTGHHRAPRAMLAVINGFTAPPDKARAIIAGEQAQYLVWCSDLNEAGNWQHVGGEAGLAAQLLADNPPEWLKRVDIGGPDTLQVWQILPVLRDQDVVADPVRPGGISAPAR